MAVADHHGQRGVHDGGIRVALEIGRDELLLGHGEDAFQIAGRGLPQGLVDGFGRHRVPRHHRQVNERDVWGGHPKRDAVEPTLQLGHDQGHGRGGAGTGRDHGEGRRPRPSQVLVRSVEQPLVTGVGMHRGHQAGLDPEAVVQDLRHRRQAVRGAGGVADHVVMRGVVSLPVHAEDDRDVLVLGRRRDDHLLRPTPIDMGFRLRGVGEESRRFDHDVDPQVPPGQVARILLGEDPHPSPIDLEGITIRADVSRVVAQDRVVLQEVSQGRRIRDVVDGRDLKVAPAVGRAEDIAADTAESIDANLHRHDDPPLNLLDHFDSPAPPAGATGSPPPTCSAATARRAHAGWPADAPVAARRRRAAPAVAPAAGCLLP